jgi:copper chaperone
MVRFQVMDMYSCRSMGAITKLVKALDDEATVRIDMVSHRVEIDSWRVPDGEFQEAIGEAGFTPIPAIAFADDGRVDVLLPIN